MSCSPLLLVPPSRIITDRSWLISLLQNILLRETWDGQNLDTFGITDSLLSPSLLPSLPPSPSHSPSPACFLISGVSALPGEHNTLPPLILTRPAGSWLAERWGPWPSYWSTCQGRYSIDIVFSPDLINHQPPALTWFSPHRLSPGSCTFINNFFSPFLPAYSALHSNWNSIKNANPCLSPNYPPDSPPARPRQGLQTFFAANFVQIIKERRPGRDLLTCDWVWCHYFLHHNLISAESLREVWLSLIAESFQVSN